MLIDVDSWNLLLPAASKKYHDATKQSQATNSQMPGCPSGALAASNKRPGSGSAGKNSEVSSVKPLANLGGPSWHSAGACLRVSMISSPEDCHVYNHYYSYYWLLLHIVTKLNNITIIIHLFSKYVTPKYPKLHRCSIKQDFEVGWRRYLVFCGEPSKSCPSPTLLTAT